MKYEPVIGLEIHVELKTRTKMFCYSKNDPDEKHPNFNICPICMGHPGTLPVINQEAVKRVVQVGLALQGKIAEFSQFDRKNYFYPDLPKGYQISQYKHPLAEGGYLEIHLSNSSRISSKESRIDKPFEKNSVSFGENSRKIRIERIHLEEDTGRLIHDPSVGSSLVDFNRAGIPLMELVTEPDLRSGEEVKKFGEELRLILRYLGASDADMEKGQMRVEVNISLRQIANRESQIERELGTKVEIKNINSFKFVADAVEYEIKRQSEILERGEKVVQETRGWNEKKEITFSQRTKEEAHDYRYFPEPDLPPLRISREEVEKLRTELPELPDAKRARFMKEYGLSPDTAGVLARDKELADYFEKVASEAKVEEKSEDIIGVIISFLTGDFLRLLQKTSSSVPDTLITPENFGELARYVREDKISRLAAKEVFEEMFRAGEDPSDIVEKKGLWQVSDSADLEDIVRHILKEYPGPAADYKSGKTQALQFLVGQVMKESRGKANPKIVQEIIKKLL